MSGTFEVREHTCAVTFDILVQPRASRAKIGPVHDGRLDRKSVV